MGLVERFSKLRSRWSSNFPPNLARLMLLGCAALWGGSYLLAKFAMEAIPPQWLMGLRMIGACLCMLALFHKHIVPGTCGIPVEERRIYVDVDAKGAVGPNHGPADPWVIHWADGRSWTVESIYARREYGRAIFGNLCVEIDVCIAKQRKTVWWENGRWFVAKGSGMAATAI